MRRLTRTTALAALLLGLVIASPADATVSGRGSAVFGPLNKRCGATFILNDPLDENGLTVTRAVTDMATGGAYCDGAVIGVKIACKNFETVYESQWEFRSVPPFSSTSVACFGQGFLSEHWIIFGHDCYAWTLSGLNGTLSPARPCV